MAVAVKEKDGKTKQVKHYNRNQRRTTSFFLFISPWLTLFILLGIIPLVLGFLTSFTNYDGLNLPYVKFVGFRNYARAFSDTDAWYSFKQTALWGLINVPAWIICSFALALILNQGIKARGFFRMIYYIPSLIPISTAVISWRIILEKNFGMLNALINLFTDSPIAIAWMADYAMAGMAMISLWMGLGVGMIIFLAGLQGIPEELIEASRIDGANSFQVFRHITFPLMTPVIFFQLIQALIGAFQQMNLPLVVATVGNYQGVPPRPVYLFMIHTYRQIFTFQRYGYGTALLWMLFAAVLILTGFVFWSQKFWVFYNTSD
ncbi:MAG: sugar ABC transporter permease [Anaerolineaceae bacterium]|nr:sugar ABC transporter permease [Anaerolineaceae bacterium]